MRRDLKTARARPYVACISLSSKRKSSFNCQFRNANWSSFSGATLRTTYSNMDSEKIINFIFMQL